MELRGTGQGENMIRRVNGQQWEATTPLLTSDSA